MTTATRRPSNSTPVTQTAIEQAAQALQSLPDKPKENLSLREAVELMQDSITAALDKGYTYEDVADMLGDQGMKIAPSSLRYYLARSKRQTQPKAKAGRRTRKTTSPAESATALAPATLPDVQSEGDEEPEPVEMAKSTRGSARKTTAKTATRTKTKSSAAATKPTAVSARRRGRRTQDS
ncbi:MAG: hypothetical protein IGS50_07485 [Synechococcales cyanobacterium C42_A2020_086]|jgi:hypothetical protein|nr:hypothetical protein [Synechococcales cyanobacterium M58_A2018_015]MBF2073588.1 hypothetical protein [Synechococcales cyanobacterium C42_A2020_086]